MPWTDFLKPRSTPPRADGRLRWFGKLPTYADYYASKPDAEWVVEFNDWILSGFARYLARQKQTGHRPPRMDPTVCILRLPKSEMTVLSLFDDYGGDMQGRPFPIVFYIGIPSAAWPGPAADTFCCASSVFDAFVGLRREMAGFFSGPSRFEVTFADRVVDLGGVEQCTPSGEWQRPLADWSLPEWYGAAPPGASETRLEAWAARLRQIGDAVARHAREPGFEPTFLFPLARGGSVDSQVAAWLAWLGARMDLGARLLSLMFPLDTIERSGQLAALARAPVVDDFLLMTPLAGRLSYVDNLVAVGDSARNDADGDAAVADLLDPSLCWLAFLTRR